MRIQKKFGERTKYFNVVQNEKVKYIFAYEGSETEVQYFNGILENRADIGINSLIELLPLVRSVTQQTDSHPNQVLKLIVEHLEQYKTIKVILDKIVDFCSEYSSELNLTTFSPHELCSDLKRYFEDDLNLNLEEDVDDVRDILSKAAIYIKETIDITNRIYNILEYIKEQEILYSEEQDHICIIIDRNMRNLSDYSAFIKKCKDKKYRLFVSNPDFEFWLLLHSNKVFDFNSKALFLNAKEDLEGNRSHRRYLENVLSLVFSGYKKGKLRFDKFLPYIRTAIKNERKFCEDIYNLENQLGTNIGVLLNEIIKETSDVV